MAVKKESSQLQQDLCKSRPYFHAMKQNGVLYIPFNYICDPATPLLKTGQVVQGWAGFSTFANFDAGADGMCSAS